MTGNPSGITNPISMTTTASTARSNMVAVSSFSILGIHKKCHQRGSNPRPKKRVCGESNP